MRRFGWGMLLFFSLFILTACGSMVKDTVSVMLIEDGFTVLSDNPLRVLPGEDAVFSLDIPEGMVCLNGDGGELRDGGTFVVPSVRYPATLRPQVEVEPERVKFFFESNMRGGRLSADVEQGWLYVGTPVKAHVEEKEGYRFNGWSIGSSVAEGGIIVSAEKEYAFVLEETTFLYANYTRTGTVVVEEDLELPLMRITYHTAGGLYEGAAVESVSMAVRCHHMYQNSLPDQGQFSRAGYQLLEYNTAEDGSGLAISPGSKIVTELGAEEAELWCVWAKESPESYFTYTSIQGGTGAAVTGYKGEETQVVIPMQLGGMPVVRIKKGAIANPKMETLVIPRTVKYVESGAFTKTDALRTVYLSDTIVTIPDDAFATIRNLQTVCLAAGRSPTYTDSDEGNFASKWERIVSAEGKKCIVIAGSTAWYGLNSPMLEELLGGEYTVINYGTNAGTSSVAYMEAVLPYIGEGDIVIHAPEYGAMTQGSNEISWKQMRCTEYHYNFWRELTVGQYTKFFSALTEFNGYRSNMTPLDYTRTNDATNAHGDRIWPREYNKDSYHFGYDLTLRTPTAEEAGRLNAIYARLEEAGALVYMSCPPVNTNALKDKWKTEEAWAEFCLKMQEAIDIPLISTPGDYIFLGRYMSNTDYHLNPYGADIRTERLFADLCAQWEKEGRDLP